MTDDENEFSETDVPKGFNIISWYMGIPLCDDTWLGMQAQHIAAVEIGIIRPLELQTARIIFNEERYGGIMLALNGVSQIWLCKVETVRFVARRDMQARPRRVIRDDLIGLTAHAGTA